MDSGCANRQRLLRAGIVAGFTFAALAGVGGALLRATAVWQNAGHDPADGTLTGYDRMAVQVGTILIGVDSASSRYREYEADVVAFSGKYYTHRFATLLHVLPGALLFLLVPLQFVPAIRSRFAAVHRWSGRLVLLLAAPLGLSGLYFGTMPFGGPLETVAVSFAGGLFFLAAARAFIAIRHGDVAGHREWMIRLLAVVLGVVTIRVVDLVILRLVAVTPRAAFAPSVCLGWAITLLAAEVWIRRTRPGHGRGSTLSPDAV